VREVKDGLWHWQAPHPAWTHDQWWPREVSSYAVDGGDRLQLFDPLAVPEEILGLAAEREPAIVLTAPWHERGAQSLVERFGAPVYTPPPDTADDLIRKYGLDPEQIPEGWHSSDVEWLVVEGRGEAHVFAAGDRLPIGVEVFPGRSHNDVVLWVERVRAVVTGDSRGPRARAQSVRELITTSPRPARGCRRAGERSATGRPLAGRSAWRATSCLILTVDDAAVVLELDAEGEIALDVGDQSLGAPALEALRLRGRREQLAHRGEADVVAADRGHDRHVVGA
jgi:hypothetical protein